MKVFVKEKQTKDGRKFNSYVAVTKDGEFVDLRFTEELIKEMQDKVGTEKAFIANKVRGNSKEVEYKSDEGELLVGKRFYVKECEFEKIPLEDLE